MAARPPARLFALLGAFTAAALPVAPARAQTLTDDFWINLQAYYPAIDTNVRVNARTQETLGTDIDLEKDLGFDQRTILTALSAGLRTGRVVFGADFFTLKRTGEAVLARPIEFDGVTYPVDARVESSFSSDIYRFSIGYSLVRQPGLELGAAIGLHATDFRVSLSGEASAGGDPAEIMTRRREVLAPLPTAGLFATGTLGPRLEATGRVDLFSLKAGDYRGTLINAQAGVNYRILDRASLGLAYRYVDYKLTVEKDEWSGRVRYKLHGPALIFQTSF